MPRNLVLAIDLEPDEFKAGPTDSWHGTQIALTELSSWRGKLAEATQAAVHFNWFFRFDPQIERNWGRRDWVLQVCPDLLPAIHQHDDMAGIHVHAWRWHEQRACWFSDFADAGWRTHCLDTSVEAFRAVFGNSPLACRFGDHAIWHEDVAILKRQGIRYDLTVEPGTPALPLSCDPLASSRLPDFRSAPRVPYQPSADDYLRPRVNSILDDDFWMVPVSVTGESHWLPLRRPPFLVRRHLPMNLVWNPRRVWRQLAGELERTAAEPIVIALRSGDLARPPYLANFKFVMERLCGHTGLRDSRLTGVDGAVAEFAAARAAAVSWCNS